VADKSKESVAQQAARHLDLLTGSPLFNAQWYCETYGDVVLSGLPAEEHFLRYGGALGRDPGPDFNSGLYASQFGEGIAPDTSALIHHLTSDSVSVSAPLSVSTARKKLWGGFSELGLAGLKQILNDPARAKNSRSAAALNLARWALGQDHWGEAVVFLERAIKIRPNLAERERVALLLIEALMRSGHPARAEALLAQWEAADGGGNFVCARNNLLMMKGQADTHQARVEALNELFIRHNLSPIELTDPEDGLVFGNIRFDPPSMTLSGPKVSVLVPVYNAEAFIDVAMQSLLCQTWSNLEIIAIEDCGSDDSWDRLQAFAAEDERVQVLRNDENMGAYPTRNRALHLATGDFVTVHDSDDWSHPQMIEHQVQALLENPALRGTCSAMVRVHPNMDFIQRPQRENTEYIHRSYPSLMMRRRDLAVLGEWDSVSANADSEMIHRIRALWGDEAISDVLPDVPLSFFLVHENSLTQQAGTNLNSVSFGIRKEYNRQATHWRLGQLAAQKGEFAFARSSMKEPFPIPQGLAPRHWPRNFSYDLILISDFGQTGALLASNMGYLEAATSLGLRVGLFHWSRGDHRLIDIKGPYLEQTYLDNIDILVPEDTVFCDLVLISHSAVLDHGIDMVPNITTKDVILLADLLPEDRWSGPVPSRGHTRQAVQRCRALFGKDPIWRVTSPRARAVFEMGNGSPDFENGTWYPAAGPLIKRSNCRKKAAEAGADRPIIIGRNGPDDMFFWPRSKDDILAAYCADMDGITARFWNGTEAIGQKLKDIPGNWVGGLSDSQDLPTFMDSLDFYVAFGHGSVIQPLLSETLHAMARGLVVIAPLQDKELFGDAALYAQPDEVADLVRSVWRSPEVFGNQAVAGRNFVEQHCGPKHIKRRLREAMSMASRRRDVA
jgi:glycosyltransferase involved in cell wall biosynthesis